MTVKFPMIYKPMKYRTSIIYLVDDDQEDRMLFREALGEIDALVIVRDFDNGVSLIANLLKPEYALPDAIFLDLNMPLMNGEECVEDIRNESHFSQIPIIIYSTYVDDQAMDRLQRKGANGYLIKPDSFENLKKLIKKSLELIPMNMSNRLFQQNFIITIS